MWYRPSRLTRLEPLDVPIEDGLTELPRIGRRPGLQIAGSLAGAVPGSSPPRHAEADDAEPEPGHERASATVKFHGLFGSGYTS